jgi:hypothetical protein
MIKRNDFQRELNQWCFFFSTLTKNFSYCCILIVRLIIKYICILSGCRTRRIVVFYFCSYSQLFACLLRFLYLLIEVAVNKYWTNVFSLSFSFSLFLTYSFSCVHTAIWFLKTMYTRRTSSLFFFFFFYFILKNMRKRENKTEYTIVVLILFFFSFRVK